MLKIHRLVPLLLVSLLAACASIPSGPSMMALPGSGKTFDQFREDDYYCKQYANEQVGGKTPNKASIASGLGSAAVAQGWVPRQGLLSAGDPVLRLAPVAAYWQADWWAPVPPALRAD